MQAVVERHEQRGDKVESLGGVALCPPLEPLCQGLGQALVQAFHVVGIGHQVGEMLVDHRPRPELPLAGPNQELPHGPQLYGRALSAQDLQRAPDPFGRKRVRQNGDSQQIQFPESVGASTALDQLARRIEQAVQENPGGPAGAVEVIIALDDAGLARIDLGPNRSRERQRAGEDGFGPYSLADKIGLHVGEQFFPAHQSLRGPVFLAEAPRIGQPQDGVRLRGQSRLDQKSRQPVDLEQNDSGALFSGSRLCRRPVGTGADAQGNGGQKRGNASQGGNPRNSRD